jgi:hypothetical protein
VQELIPDFRYSEVNGLGAIYRYRQHTDQEKRLKRLMYGGSGETMRRDK